MSKPPVPAEIYKPPARCSFCSKAIEEGDFFWAGYDKYKIYSETCDYIRCHQWLVNKKRFKKKYSKK